MGESDKESSAAKNNREVAIGYFGRLRARFDDQDFNNTYDARARRKTSSAELDSVSRWIDCLATIKRAEVKHMDLVINGLTNPTGPNWKVAALEAIQNGAKGEDALAISQAGVDVLIKNVDRLDEFKEYASSGLSH